MSLLSALTSLNQVESLCLLTYQKHAIGLLDSTFAKRLPTNLFVPKGDQLTLHSDDGFPQQKIETWFQTYFAENQRNDWRDECFTVFPLLCNDLALGRLDRGIFAYLGMCGRGVHVNGYVRKDENLWMWVAQRAQHKKTDAGKWDHIAAGGITHPLTPFDAMQKESAEEANIDTQLSRQAVLTSTLNYIFQQGVLIRPDTIFCYDLLLPTDFVPKNNDGEVQQFALQPIQEVLHDIAHTDKYKLNCRAAIIDFALRHGEIEPTLATQLTQKLAEGTQVIQSWIR